MYFVRRKQRVKGRGKKNMKDDVKNQRKGSLPSPLSGTPLPIHPSLSTLPRVKQFCCCLVDYKSGSALPCKASQDKNRRSSLPWLLCHFVAREQQGFRQNLLERHQSLRHRNWPNQLTEPKMKPKINILFAEQTFGSHMFVCNRW